MKDKRKISDLTGKKVVFIDWQYVFPGYGSRLRHEENPKSTHAMVPRGINLEIFPPRVENLPVFSHEMPWEQGYIAGYSTVFRDEKTLKLYYEVFHQKNYDKWTDYDSFLCYAESKTGNIWKRPNLGLVNYHNNKENNILITPETNPLGVGIHGSHIFKDSHGTKEERYKISYCGPKGKTYGGSSPDGIHWNLKEKVLADTEADSQNIIYWDEELEKYIGYFRTWYKERRGIIRAESESFWNWPDFNEFDLIFISDPNQPPDSDYYTNGFHIWPGTTQEHRAYLMFPSIYHRTQDYLDTEMYVSRTGKQWFRPCKAPIKITKDIYGIHHKGAIYFGRGIWEDEEPHTWNIFHSHYPHGHNDPKPEGNTGGLFKAQYREDGFMGLKAANFGEFWTTIFCNSSPHLKVNTLTGDPGFIEIGLYDQLTQREIPGFTVDDCDLLNGDIYWKTVSWNGEEDLSYFDDVKLRLHIKMKQTALFALKFE